MSQEFILFLKRSLRPLKQKLRRSNGVILFAFLKLCCVLLKPKITLTYASSIKTDGVGAQIQRILAIRSLSTNLRLGYLHTEIEELAIHPLDSYQNNEEMKEFLLKLNREFWMDNSVESFDRIAHERKINALTFPFFFSCIVYWFFSRKQTLIRLVEPYPVSEFDPNLYRGILHFLPNFVLPPKKAPIVAVHYRRGVGGFAIQQGESVSREIPRNYFAAVAKEIIDATKHTGVKLVVFTDSPTEDFVYEPPTDQSHLWTSSPNFSQGKMRVQGLDVREVFSEVSDNVEVVFGGDPLEVIKRLASADHLILSRSSFGYVAAILNSKGRVYFPSQFWHVPMKGWHVVRELDYK